MGSKSPGRPKWVQSLVFLSKSEMIQVVGDASETKHLFSVIAVAVQQGRNSSQ